MPNFRNHIIGLEDHKSILGSWVQKYHYHYRTLPTAEILSGKNERAWISMVLYLKKNKLKLKYYNKKILGDI